MPNGWWVNGRIHKWVVGSWIGKAISRLMGGWIEWMDGKNSARDSQSLSCSPHLLSTWPHVKPHISLWPCCVQDFDKSFLHRSSKLGPRFRPHEEMTGSVADSVVTDVKGHSHRGFSTGKAEFLLCFWEMYFPPGEEKAWVLGRGTGPSEEEWSHREYGRAISKGHVVDREER